MMLIPFRAGASVEEVGGQVSGTMKKCFSHASLGSMPLAILTSSGSRRICCALCAAHRPWIGDRGHLASPPLAKPTQLVPSGKSIHIQLHFRFSSVSPGWRGDRARRQQEDRDEGRAPERALFELMSVQRGFVSRTNHSRTGISCERLIFSISISNFDATEMLDVETTILVEVRDDS
jgi:hypothetical protein